MDELPELPEYKPIDEGMYAPPPSDPDQSLWFEPDELLEGDLIYFNDLFWVVERVEGRIDNEQRCRIYGWVGKDKWLLSGRSQRLGWLWYPGKMFGGKPVLLVEHRGKAAEAKTQELSEVALLLLEELNA